MGTLSTKQICSSNTLAAGRSLMRMFPPNKNLEYAEHPVLRPGYGRLRRYCWAFLYNCLQSRDFSEDLRNVVGEVDDGPEVTEAMSSKQAPRCCIFARLRLELLRHQSQDSKLSTFSTGRRTSRNGTLKPPNRATWYASWRYDRS